MDNTTSHVMDETVIPAWQEKTEDGYYRWQIFPDGSIWRFETHCYGNPPGSCIRRHTPDTDPYCPTCSLAYEDDVKREKQRERTEAILTAAYDCGALPGDFKRWHKKGLYPWQIAARDALYMNDDCSAWIQGAPGTGKTELAFSIIDMEVKRGKECAFATGREVVSATQEYARRRAYTQYDLLVIDDVDKFNMTEFACSELHYILDRRNRNHIRTVVTSEFSGKRVAQMLGETGHYGRSTIERLSWPKRPCLKVEMKGDNLRRNETQGEL